jgi:hypothetical protein
MRMVAGEMKNVGAPTFKVLLEVAGCVAERKRAAASEKFQNGTAPEVIL